MKTIMVKDEAYYTLKEAKKENESFSQTITRLCDITKAIRAKNALKKLGDMKSQANDNEFIKNVNKNKARMREYDL